MSTLTNAIKQKLSEKIITQRAANMFKLSSERELGEEFATTRVTVREALRLLETEGLIYRENRRGWFIAPARLNYDPGVHSRISFVDYATQQGFRPTTKVLGLRKISADAYLSSVMRTSEGKPLYEIERLRSLDDRPVLFERMVVRADLLPGLEEVDLSSSFHALIRETYQMEISEADFEVVVSSMPDEVAPLLLAPKGLSSLKFGRRYFNQHGVIFEYDQEYWRHDAISLQFGFQNTP